MTGRFAMIFCFGLSLTARRRTVSRPSDSGKSWIEARATGEEILAVLLDSDIHAATRDGYPDLRIVDDRGIMVPYLLEPVAQHRTIQVRQPCASKVVSLHVDEGKGLEIVIELDEKASSRPPGRRSEPRWPTMSAASAFTARGAGLTGPSW